MNVLSFLRPFGAVILLCFVAPFAGTGHAQTKRIVDKYVDSYSLDSAPLSENGYPGFWIDGNQLICTLLPEGTVDIGAAKKSRVALVNFATKSFRIIADDAALLGSFDEETHEAYLGKWGEYNGTFDPNSPVRAIRIRSDGAIVEVRRYPTLMSYTAAMSIPRTDLEVPRGAVAIALRKRDGFLLRDKIIPGEEQARIRADTPVLTTWIRPGKPPLKLPIRFDEIHAAVEYLPFLNKYLLNRYDTQGSSDTDSHMRSAWSRPYEFTPFRLLGPDGKIDEIPYPRFVFEYGIADQPKQDHAYRNFNDFILSKAGPVIRKVRRSEGTDIYLFQNDQLYRISTSKVPKADDKSSLMAEGVYGMNLSPDGCKIAFGHYHVDGTQPMGYTPKYLSIIDVCKEGK
jgi:hypothetical protein